ncbi:MAG: hypothetical protein WCL44_07510 [bacterium]
MRQGSPERRCRLRLCVGGDDAGETIDRYIDVLAGAGITELFCNTNARLTNYRSDVWDRIRLATGGDPVTVFQVEAHMCP